MAQTVELNFSPFWERLVLFKEADCILWVVDAEDPDWNLPDSAKQRVGEAFAYLLVNKQDSASGVAIPEAFKSVPVFHVSAKTGEGIQAFQDAWLSDLEARLPDLSSESVIVSARHEEALLTSAIHLDASLLKLDMDEPVELAVSDLREAMEALGKIVGKIDNECMLDHLFSHFCIGK